MVNIPQSPMKPKVSSPDIPVNTKESSWRMVGFGIGLLFVAYFLAAMATLFFGWGLGPSSADRLDWEPMTSDKLLKQPTTIAPSEQ